MERFKESFPEVRNSTPSTGGEDGEDAQGGENLGIFDIGQRMREYVDDLLVKIMTNCPHLLEKRR